MSLAVQQRHCD